MIRRPPRSTPLYSSAASDVYKRQGQAILSFRNISTASGIALGATVVRNLCSLVQRWTKRPSEPRWMPALPSRKMGSILRAGATSATRFHLGIFLITRTIPASPFARSHVCRCAKRISAPGDGRPNNDTAPDCSLIVVTSFQGYPVHRKAVSYTHLTLPTNREV